MLKVIIATLCEIAKLKKKSKYPSMQDRLNKLWYIHIHPRNPMTTKPDGESLRVRIQKNSEGVMLSEQSNTVFAMLQLV